MRLTLFGALIVFSAMAAIPRESSVAFSRESLGGDQSAPTLVSSPIPNANPAVAREEALAQVERERYRGIAVATQSGATGDVWAIQREIADALEALDFVPVERLGHFQRLLECPTVLTGWTGSIEEMIATPDGVLVRVKVVPENTNGVAAVNDSVTETYIYVQGQLQYLGLEGPAVPAVITFH